MSDPDLIETQYRKILLHIWKEEEIFGGELPNDSAQFWAKILQYNCQMVSNHTKNLLNMLLTHYQFQYPMLL